MKQIEDFISKSNYYRNFLERMWIETFYQEKTSRMISQYMCRYSCLFLQSILLKNYKILSIVVTGQPTESLNGTRFGLVGFKDCYGNWHDHSWLVVSNIIIDLTADQFGESKIIVTNINDERYKPSNNQDQFKNTYEKLEKVSHRWLEKYYLENSI